MQYKHLLFVLMIFALQSRILGQCLELTVGTPLIFRSIPHGGSNCSYVIIPPRNRILLSVSTISSAYLIDGSLSPNFDVENWSFQPSQYVIHPTLFSRTVYFRILNSDITADFSLTLSLQLMTMKSVSGAVSIEYPTEPTYYYATVMQDNIFSFVIGPAPFGTQFSVTFGKGDYWDGTIANTGIVNSVTPLVYNNNDLTAGYYYFLLSSPSCTSSCNVSTLAKFVSEYDFSGVNNHTYIIPSGFEEYFFAYSIPQLTELYVTFGKHGQVMAKIGSQPMQANADYYLGVNDHEFMINPQPAPTVVYFSVSGVGSADAAIDTVWFVQRPITVTLLDYNNGKIVVPLNKSSVVQDYYYTIIVPNRGLTLQVILTHGTNDTVQLSVDRKTFGYNPLFLSDTTTGMVIYSNRTLDAGSYGIVVRINVVDATSYVLQTKIVLPIPPKSPLTITVYVFTSIILFVVLCIVLGSCVLMSLGYCLRANDSKSVGARYDNDDKALLL